MRTSFKISPVLASAALFMALALVPVVSFAAMVRAGKQATVGSNETINDDLYIAGGSVSSSGEIRGDLTVMGGNVLVTGPVEHYVNAAGGSVTLLGNVGAGIRVASGNVTIQSDVGGDVMVVGGTTEIAGGSIGRDVVALGGSLRIDAPVAGNVRFKGGEIYINAPVSGTVDVDADKVTLGPAAVISGTFTYKASQEVMMEEGAQVQGAVNYTPRVERRGGMKDGFLKFFALIAVAKLLMILAGALFFGLFFRPFMKDLITEAFAEPFAELGRGLVILIVLPVLSVLLLLTVVGIPLGVFSLLAFVLLSIFSALIAPIFLGSILYRWVTKRTSYDVSWKTILLGVIVYFLIGFVPLVGWAAQCGFWLLALGVAAKMKWSMIKKLR